MDPLELADALGYLEGLKLDKVGDVQGGPESLQALATNQIDISAAAFFGASAKLIATGVPIKAVVATYGSNDTDQLLGGHPRGLRRSTPPRT